MEVVAWATLTWSRRLKLSVSSSLSLWTFAPFSSCSLLNLNISKVSRRPIHYCVPCGLEFYHDGRYQTHKLTARILQTKNHQRRRRMLQVCLQKCWIQPSLSMMTRKWSLLTSIMRICWTLCMTLARMNASSMAQMVIVINSTMKCSAGWWSTQLFPFPLRKCFPVIYSYVHGASRPKVGLSRNNFHNVVTTSCPGETGIDEIKVLFIKRLSLLHLPCTYPYISSIY